MRNTRFNIEIFLLASLSFIGLIIFAGCQHNPVYPDIGSVYIYTEPDQAEVLMDGQMLRLITPVKIDGIPVGLHTFTLRHNNFKTMTFSLEVKPGQTRRVYKDLSPITLQKKDTLFISAGDMDLTDDGDIFLTNLLGDNITVARVSDNGQISTVDQINVGGPQRLIAANKSANRAFFTRKMPDSEEEEIVGLEILSHKIIRTIYLNNIKYYSALAISPDGNILAAADSLNKRLILIDSRLCTVIKTISTTGFPTDLSFDRNNPMQIYVTQSGAKRFDLVNLETGVVVNSIGTGESPGAIFWDKEYTRVGFSNRRDLTYTIVDINSWTSATSGNQLAGQFVTSVCWSNADDYILWALDYTLGTLYVPNWQQTSKIYNGSHLDGPHKLVKLIRTEDGNILLMLNTGQLVTVKLGL
ncbi:MAG: PEGA domain-containing protein [Candidatus Edwardsbacteria bacterium]|nr:PEGA domain-containing protein [Candidatus Edwardsbacteria bacterium]MBU1576222.1 PEGA domain-containing protein [Candidatus Edwardsbacteria bacterium]MBU2464146.1 PEGA domain-containing protein [Candidatus Edwardsbacteria bacterium]MBU2594364.1 PEGA domain-containing protein [Candidatus Edwardsbacteria bacterium]